MQPLPISCLGGGGVCCALAVPQGAAPVFLLCASILLPLLGGGWGMVEERHNGTCVCTCRRRLQVPVVLDMRRAANVARRCGEPSSASQSQRCRAYGSNNPLLSAAIQDISYPESTQYTLHYCGIATPYRGWARTWRYVEVYPSGGEARPCPTRFVTPHARPHPTPQHDR